MNCTKLCGSRVSIRRALYLAAAQIVLALILAASSGPEQAGDDVDHAPDDRIVTPAETSRL